MSVAATAAPPVERSLSFTGLSVLAIGSVDLSLEQSLILPALPALARHYDASLTATSWLATGYLLAAVVANPLLGRFGDMFGRRRLLLVALGAFTVGGLLCALAGSIELVIVGRIVQGMGACASALTLGILRDAVPSERLARCIGIVIGGISVGAAIGFVLSGVLVDHVSAPAIFWCLSALSFLVMVGVFAFVPESPGRKRVPIDAVGAVLLGAGLAALLLAISKGNSWHWDSASTVGLFAASAALLAAFALTEIRVRQPLVDLALVVASPFAQANACIFAVAWSTFGALIIIPPLAATPEASGYGLGYSTIKTGLLLLPEAVLALAASWVAGRWVDRIGPRTLMVAGSAAGLVGYVFAAVRHGDAIELAVFTALVGVTVGFTLTPIWTVVTRGATTDKASVAVGVNNVVRVVASAIAAAAATAVISGAGFTGPYPAESGFTRAFVMGAIACCAGMVASVLLRGRSGRPRSKPARA